MPTTRQQMIEVLSKEPLEARELSQLLGIREKEVFEHLAHIVRSLNRHNRRLVVTPSKCLACGYVFSKRGRLEKPGRCHRCKKERISAPRFQVV